jgi:hypothetical protein
MLPRSEALEDLLTQAKQVLVRLNQIGSAELGRSDLKDAVAEIARNWLRSSPAIRQAGICDSARLTHFDQSMQALLGAVGGRTRGSTLAKKLAPFIDDVLKDVVVPVIQFEGSPRQVAARQIVAGFGTALEPEESPYLEEAAQCVTVEAYRAAIIMIWAAAVARLHAAIIKRGFDAFNAAVDSVRAKSGQPYNRVKEGAKVSSLPELQRSRDADLLVVGMELFRYDLQVYQELDRLLGTRNDAAHPGMGSPGALDVQQFAAKVGACIFHRVKL